MRKVSATSMSMRNDEDMLEKSQRERHHRFSTRLNSDFKWKLDKSVVGALEVKSLPYFDPTARMKESDVIGMEQEFAECSKFWKELHLRRSFIEAVQSIPPETTCCGLMREDNATVKKLVPLLNEGWVNGINEQIKDRGYRISCFVWSWSNATGKTNSVVLMIRFHSLTHERN
ncbi:unnamed protein product [Cylindrotheca closterium]|uniref:Uncharacterized protein n=1 Tax=Cylindrotheca closterium TaxID=2856 RepID=A0AAD2G3S0_9STRA|nr:unnamed protein product [Cylindrotheca closterium]